MDVARTMTDYVGQPTIPKEDDVTKAIERYTGGIPSSAFLAVAVGAIGLALVSQLAGRGKWGNFIAQWVPTLLITGVYNKLVKLEGHDQTDRGLGGRRAPARSESRDPAAKSA